MTNNIPRLARTLAAAILVGMGAASGVMSQPGAAPPRGGDVFNNNTAGGLPGEPAIDRYGRDAECGGTNRAYYDQMYGTTGVVVSIEQMQEDSRRDEVIRCGACGQDKAICWLHGQGGRGPLIAQGPLKGSIEQREFVPGESSHPDYPPPRTVGPEPQSPPPAGTLEGGTVAEQKAKAAGATSVALIGGASAGGCRYSAKWEVGLPNGHGSETIFICLGDDHEDGDIVSGYIQKIGKGSRVYRTIEGKFGRSAEGVSFKPTSLNGVKRKSSLALPLDDAG